MLGLTSVTIDTAENVRTTMHGFEEQLIENGLISVNENVIIEREG
jgi:hypothetical protein